MVQKKTTKTKARSTTSRATTTAKRPSTTVRKAVTVRKPASKPAAKRPVKKTSVARKKVDKVDYYPNRVALLVATSAVLVLLCLGLLTAQ